jgi:hypothetical protein
MLSALGPALARQQSQPSPLPQEQPQPRASEGDPSGRETGRSSGAAVVVNINQSPTESRQTEPQQPADSDGNSWINPNWVIAFLTIVLAGAAVAQWLDVRRQANAMESQLDVMRGQVALAQRSVDVANTNAQAALDTATATKQSIILTHRPKIMLRNVDVPHIEHGGYGDGTLWATNVGDTVAHVFKFDAMWFVGEHLPMRNPYARAEPTKTNIKNIQPGSSQHFDLPAIVFPQDDQLTWHRAIHQEPRIPEPTHLFLIGVVKYRDDLDNLRRTGFCRRYNRQTGRFEPVDDPDYEHAD